MYSVLIRPLEIEDATISYKWRNDAEVWAQTGNKPDRLITFEIEHKWIQGVLADETTKRFAITVDGKYVGNVQLTNVSNTDAEFHIFIGEKDYWGKGIAKEATYQILHYAREVLKLEDIFLFVKSSNLTAIKVYEKNSFVFDSNAEHDFLKMKCNLLSLPVPMVSIFCMVYNHEQYIGEAIESFLMQKINFSSIIVIGEDCSTDNSRQIIMQYATKFPGKFKLLFHKTNIGAGQNQELVLKNCSGKYIAMCEGDDYWTDSSKLKNQVEFLELNPDYSLTCHRYSILTVDGFLVKDYEHHLFNENKSSIIIDEYVFLNHWLTKSLTVVFRNSLFNMEEYVGYAYLRDFHIYYHLIEKGKGICFDFNGGIYRRTVSGIHSSINELEREVILKEILLEIYNKTESPLVFDKYQSTLVNILYFEHKNSSYVIPNFVKIFQLKKYSTFQKIKLSLVLLLNSRLNFLREFKPK